jgi:hypothetical protein
MFQRITMTKAQALAKQAEQVAYYAKHHPGIADRVAAVTTADALEDGVDYDMGTINRHVPRGAAIERLAGLPDMGGN